ncbi:MAG: acetoin utilization protein AcuC [Lentisphaerae bacterium]|nr:acetoin utilization protein AcuC [Lentisphaerota bacterium]
MTRKKYFLHCPDLDRGGYPPDCPFNTHRAGLTRKKLVSIGALTGSDIEERAPVPAVRQELELFHTARYLNIIREAENGNLTVESLEAGLGTPDCPVFKGMYDFVALACGASITGARLILAGEAFMAFNPSGGFHHAEPEKAGGFCYMNDVVLAAIILTQSHKRVAFIDLDVHHCDGVQKAFYDRNDVITISLHENGKTLFPGTGWESETGHGAGEGYNVNIPLPVGTYDGAYKYAFQNAAFPLLKAYDPDVVILELGMDGLAGDPLAHLNLTNNVHADIISMIMSIGKPILMTGGGGYNVPNTVRGWALAWRVLCGEEGGGELGLGMGGVMLETTEWTGGLRDRILISDAGTRMAIDREVKRVVGRIKATLFPYHGLDPELNSAKG